jgi:hypothetical protein
MSPNLSSALAPRQNENSACTAQRWRQAIACSNDGIENSGRPFFRRFGVLLVQEIERALEQIWLAPCRAGRFWRSCEKISINAHSVSRLQ